jgi:nucleotide-binding universal stress UspA family protein
MSKRVTWLVFAAILVAGLLLGFVGSVLIPNLGLVALYERVGGWTLLGRAAVALLLLAIPIGYIVWLVAGAAEFAKAREKAETESLLRYLRHGERTEAERVLVATGGGPHARFGLHLAASLARAGDGRVTVFRAISPSEEVDPEAESETLARTAEQVIGPDPLVEARVTVSPSVVDAIVEETRRGGYDLLIIGGSDERTVKSLLFGTIPDTVAGRTGCPVLVVRESEWWPVGEEQV